jgi:class 3 adenylate cyclase
MAALLSRLGLAHYAAAFAEAEIDLEVLPLLSESDLKELGLSLGARRKLAAAIASGLEAAPESASSRAENPDSAQAEPEPERRPLTVMFCDLVGSTELTLRLDPEEMGDITRRFQDAAAAAIARCEGFVDRFMGDGLLAFFGYPRAQENAAERAVQAGFAIIAATSALGTPDGSTLAVRVGIASGVAFVGEMMAHGGAREQVAAGEVLNLAARIQQIAPANSIAISAETRDLLRGLFELEELGQHALKGIDAKVPVWRVLRERALATRYEAADRRAVSPLVGREAEAALLADRWEAACGGEGQLVLLSAEPGLGKSRLVHELRERAAERPHLTVRYQCSPMHTNSALYPAAAQIRFAAGIDPEDAPERQLEKLAALLGRATDDIDEPLKLIALLLSIPTPLTDAAQALSTDQVKHRTLEILVAQMLGLARNQPLMFLVEDAHWMDPTTQELMSLAINAIQNASVLILITYRPEFQHRWGGLPYATTLRLGQLTRPQTRTLITHVAGGKELPGEVVDQIIARTDGVPLFVEELTKGVLGLGVLVEQDGRYVLKGSLSGLAIPATLRDSLLARVDALASAKEVAQVGSVLGREFRLVHLAAMSGIDDAALEQGVSRLIQEELIRQHGSRAFPSYVFKHALVQEAAYSTLVQARRRQLHARCAQILQELSPEIGEEQPEILAQHYAAAGDGMAAAEHWLRAGRNAVRHSAHHEAIGHLRAGLASLSQADESDHRQELELLLQLELGVPLIATQGYAARETEAAWERARVLAEQRHDNERLVQALYGLWAAQVSIGRVRQALGTAEQMLGIAARLADAGIDLVGRRIRGLTLFMLGDLAGARADLERTIAGYDGTYHQALAFRFGQDPRVSARAVLATVLALGGEAEQARSVGRLSLEEASTLHQTNSEAYALAYGACMVAWMQGDAAETEVLAERLTLLARENGMRLWGAYGNSFRGWVLVENGQVACGLALIEEALAAFRSGGSGIYEPMHRGLYAAALARAGRPGAASAAMEDVLAEARRREEIWCVPELLRLKARITLAARPDDIATASLELESAIDAARRHGLRLWEAKARADLGNLRHGVTA